MGTLNPFEYLRRVVQSLDDRIDQDACRLVIYDLQMLAIVEGGLNVGRDAHLTAEIIKAKVKGDGDTKRGR